MEKICVGICTFKRPESLERLLEKMRMQITHNLFTYSALVVDNDIDSSALKVVKKILDTNFDLSYYNEKEKNIAKARNRVLELSKGDYLALIDDDEYPDDSWLFNHYSTCKKYNSDGSLGPVISQLPEMCPKWIRESNVCTRKSFETGYKIKPHHARTGNCFLKKDKLEENECYFDNDFGLTGGEDIDFFYRLITTLNFNIVWCKEAVVFEPVIEERLKRSFYIRRAMKRGGNNQRFLKKNRSITYAISILILSFLKMLIILLVSPLIVLTKEKFRMRIIESFFHHFGRMQAALK